MNQAILKQKEAVVDEVVARAKKAAALVLVEYRGMNVTQIGELRRLMRGLNAQVAVYKNTMVRRASDKLNYHGLADHLTGPNALVFCPDPIEGPKALVKFARRTGIMSIKGGVVDGRVLDSNGVKTVAMLPGKTGLISMFLSCIQSPIRSFAATLKAVSEKN
ncbi:MAG: 50S ribosomal protein L10 [Bacilli bacterium]